MESGLWPSLFAPVWYGAGPLALAIRPGLVWCRAFGPRWWVSIFSEGPTARCYTSLGQRPISANFKISHGIISIIRFRALARHRRLSFKSSLIRSHSAITSLILKAGSMAACNRCSMKANSRQRLRSGLQLAAPGGKIPRLAGQLFCQQADKQFPVKPRSCAAVVSLGEVAGIR